MPCRSSKQGKHSEDIEQNLFHNVTPQTAQYGTGRRGSNRQTRSGPNRIAAAIGGVIFQDLWLKFNLCLEDYEQLTNEQQEEEIVPLIDLLGIGAGKNPKILRMSNKTTFLEQWAGLFRR